MDLTCLLNTSLSDYLSSSFRSICFQCTHFQPDGLGIIVLNCGCQFCASCLKDMLISATDGNIVQNVFEKENQQQIKCVCDSFFDCTDALGKLEMLGEGFGEEKNRAKLRMGKYAFAICMICKASFLNEDDSIDVNVDTNNKKQNFRMKIKMKSIPNEFVKGIDYIDSDHIICAHCYRKELQKETYIKSVEGTNGEYKQFICMVCMKEHIIEEKEFEGKMQKSCCAEKCIIY